MEIKSSKFYWLEILITLFTISAYFLALSPINFWWLLWIALVPLILYSFYGKTWLTILITLVSFITYSSLLKIAYLKGTLFTLNIVSSDVIIYSLIMGVSIWLNSIIIKKWRFWGAVFFFPSIMVANYFLQVSLNNNCLLPAPEIGLVQFNFLSFNQIISITGIWGLSFLLNLLPNAFATIVFYWREKKIYLPIIITTLLLFIGAMVFGYYKISQPIATTKIRVGMAAQIYKQPVSVTLPKQVEKDLANPFIPLNAYLNNIAILAKQGAQYILQPEYALFFPVNFADKQKILNAIKDSAKKYGVTVLFAFGEFDSTTQEVKKDHLIIFSPDGDVLGNYDKQHLAMAPFHENKMISGDRIVTFPYQTALLGIAICRDMAYIDPSKEYGKNRTGMLFVPALDFSTGEALLAPRIVLMQAIANGFSLARAAAYGDLILSDYNGKIIALKSTSQTEPVYLVGDIPVGVGNTFYARHGNWFAWLCVIVAGLLLLLFINRRTKTFL